MKRAASGILSAFSKGFLALLSLLLSFFPAKAQQDSLAHTLLWKIEGNGLSRPSYLYGTMHTTDDRAFRLMDSTLIAFDSVEVYAMEINMDSVNPSAMAASMMMEDTLSLRGLLSKQEFKKVNKYSLKRAGVPLFLLNRIKPIFVWLIIQEGKSSKKEDVLDLYFFNMAKKQNKVIYGLERAEDQLKLLYDLPLDKQKEILLSGVEALESGTDEEEELYDQYAGADLNKLLAEAEADTSFGGQFMELFLNKRNRVMAEGMHRLMQRHSVFTAVGAAHLPGRQGVINLLREKGYTVSPVLSNVYLDPKEVKKKNK